MQDYLKALDSSQEKVIATCLGNQCVGGEKYNVLMGVIVTMNKTILKLKDDSKKNDNNWLQRLKRQEGFLYVLCKGNKFVVR